MAALRYKIYLWVLKNTVFYSFAALTREIFSTLKEKFCISTRPCNILYMFFLMLQEDEQTACSDGTFNGQRYFTCPSGRGFFTLLSHCRQDSRFTPNSPISDPDYQSSKGTSGVAKTKTVSM